MHIETARTVLYRAYRIRRIILTTDDEKTRKDAVGLLTNMRHRILEASENFDHGFYIREEFVTLINDYREEI